ncbi:hypothetical protein MKX01_035898, partial [Papaver californicum]
MSVSFAEKDAERIWKNIGNFIFSFHDKNIYIINFENAADKDFILQKKFSSFNGHLVIMHPWDPT